MYYIIKVIHYQAVHICDVTSASQKLGGEYWLSVSILINILKTVHRREGGCGYLAEKSDMYESKNIKTNKYN